MLLYGFIWHEMISNDKNTPNPAGTFNRQAIIPSADSFFFVGFFWTISDNKKDNQLNNL